MGEANVFQSNAITFNWEQSGSLVLYNQGWAFHYKLTGEKNMDAAVSKYGGYRGLAAHMAAKAQQYLSPST